jgi:hypothetical protein
MKFEKILSKFEFYLQSDKNLLRRLRSKNTSSSSDYSYLQREYTDLIFSYKEFCAFISGMHGNNLYRSDSEKMFLLGKKYSI